MNIVVAGFIIVFVLLAILGPMFPLLDVLDTQMTSLQDTTRYARDINGDVIQVTSGGALGDLTLGLLYGLGFFFLLGFVVYVIKFGPGRPPVERSGDVYV